MDWLTDWTLTPGARRHAAALMFVASVVAWPVTALTVFSTEPQGILGLSWLSIILQAVTILATTDVREQQEGE